MAAGRDEGAAGAARRGRAALAGVSSALEPATEGEISTGALDKAAPPPPAAARSSLGQRAEPAAARPARPLTCPPGPVTAAGTGGYSLRAPRTRRAARPPRVQRLREEQAARVQCAIKSSLENRAACKR